MGHGLSQSQVNELLRRVRMEQAEEPVLPDKRAIKQYDFSSPKKFTKDQFRLLSNLYENFSRILSSYFTGILRGVCEVSVTQIDELRYNEFSNDLPDNSLVGMMGFTPQDGQYDEAVLLVDLSTTFGYLLIDRLMGGVDELFVPKRNYTEIELAILRTVMDNVAAYLQEAWCNYLQTGVQLRSIETNGRMLQAFAPQDIVVVVTLEIREAGYVNRMNLCMAADSLEKIIAGLSMRRTHSMRQQDPDKERVKQELMLDTIEQSELVLEAVLNESQMSLGQLMQLRPGDVVALDQKIDGDICVKVADTPWFYARLGEREQKKALKIVDTAK